MTTQTQERTWNFGRLGPEIPPGPWTDEPDKAQWVDEATDLDCLILRNRSGALCGYVGVPETHPWFGKGYSQCLDENCSKEDYCYTHSPEAKIEVHGGLTFADACNEGRGDDAICHVPFEGRSARVWWFGFDCAHCFDFSPGYAHKFARLSDEIYRPIGYVKAECAGLARQLAEVSA